MMAWCVENEISRRGVEWSGVEVEVGRWGRDELTHTENNITSPARLLPESQKPTLRNAVPSTAATISERMKRKRRMICGKVGRDRPILGFLGGTARDAV